jgi:hypothetical protein
MDPHPDPEVERRASKYRNPGGTSGGLGEFLLGLGLLIAGAYLFLSHVIVMGNIGGFLFGFGGFGLTLIPIFLGIGLLFFDGKSVWGWLLTGGGAIAIFVGVLAQMNIFFKPTSLFDTLLMIVLMAAGIGLIARSLRSH